MNCQKLILKITALVMAIVLCTPAFSLADSSTVLSGETQISQVIAATDNPLIRPEASVLTDAQKISAKTGTINILLLGIDDLNKDYTYRQEMAHTDAIMVVSIQPGESLTGHLINLVSIPRDTMAYIPGVKGIYKINAAINCGDALAVGATRADAENVTDESDMGFQMVCDAVSGLLGGVQIHYYCAITMQAMAALGDLIGGVDYDLEMSYTGSDENNKRIEYYKGMQHMDGSAIVSYFRARHNATVDTGSDEARTDRQRNMMEAIFSMFVDDKTLVLKVLAGLKDNPTIQSGFYTNIDTAVTAQLTAVGLQTLASLTGDDNTSLGDLFGSYALEGDYHNAFGNWMFRFADQDNRVKVIHDVFGADVTKQAYVSYKYATWLYKYGLKAVRYLAVADQIRQYIADQYDYESPLATVPEDHLAKTQLSQEQWDAVAAMDAAYGDTLRSFLAAASAVDTAALNGDKYDSDLTKTMQNACKALQKAGNTLAKQTGYSAKTKVKWASGVYVDEDSLINKIYVNFR